jgi:hypothetical protein
VVGPGRAGTVADEPDHTKQLDPPPLAQVFFGELCHLPNDGQELPEGIETQELALHPPIQQSWASIAPGRGQSRFEVACRHVLGDRSIDVAPVLTLELALQGRRNRYGSTTL